MQQYFFKVTKEMSDRLTKVAKLKRETKGYCLGRMFVRLADDAEYRQKIRNDIASREPVYSLLDLYEKDLSLRGMTVSIDQADVERLSEVCDYKEGSIVVAAMIADAYREKEETIRKREEKRNWLKMP